MKCAHRRGLALRLLKLNGFTIIELITVILLLSILSAVAFVMWPGDQINLDAQAKAVAADIRYAQNLSMTRGVRYEFLRVSTTTYQISTVGGADVTSRTLGNRISFGTFTNLPNNLVAFDGRGAPYTDTATPGTALSSAATITLTGGGATRTITITPGTGRVAVS